MKFLLIGVVGDYAYIFEKEELEAHFKRIGPISIQSTPFKDFFSKCDQIRNFLINFLIRENKHPLNI